MEPTLPNNIAVSFKILGLKTKIAPKLQREKQARRPAQTLLSKVFGSFHSTKAMR